MDNNPLADLAVDLKTSICYFGTTNNKGVSKTFGVLSEDRRKHLYILGKTGMGKTTLLQNMVLQDIYNGFGVCFVDPHGDPSEYILDRIPTHRQNDVVYFNPADTDFPIGLNMFEATHGEERFLIASGLIAVFHRLWQGMWSARMEYILNNTLLALLENPDSTLLSIIQMLTDIDFRKKVVENITDPLIKNFWTKEFSNFNDRYRQEAISPILNKIGQFLANDLTRNIVGQKKSTINFREIIDNQKILVVNLSKGKLGEDNSNLLGCLIVTKLQLAALSRADVPEKDRKDFYLYVDEFQNFTTDSFTTILSEARKYKLNLILAHQYISQLTESGNDKIKSAIFGNVGTIISFRLGSEDADFMAKEFAPIFEPKDFLSLEKTQIALSLSIKDNKSKPFLANTLAPIFDKLAGRFIVNAGVSRQKYGIPKNQVVDEINKVMKNKVEVNSNLKSQANPSNIKINRNSGGGTEKLKNLRNSRPSIQLNNQTNQVQPKLPLVPNTNLSLPQNGQYSDGNLAALKRAKAQVAATNSVKGPKLILGKTPPPDLNPDDNFFHVPGSK